MELNIAGRYIRASKLKEAVDGPKLEFQPLVY
jgi:hypothetical protein